MLRPEVGRSLPEGASYQFCVNPKCDLLYFDDAGFAAVKSDASVRVGIKETSDPIPLCYCLGITRADVQTEVARTGACNIPARIATEVKEGRCACEIKNPSGACCLGEVRKAVKEALAALQARAVGGKP